MYDYTSDPITYLVASLVLLGQIGLVIIFIGLIAKSKFIGLIAKNAILLSFIIALSSTLGSLYYSVIVQLEPCSLCWWQRIFMFPQVLILGIALYKKDLGVRIYSLALAIAGGLISLYNLYLELNFNPLLPCSTAPGAVDCSEPYFRIFGFMSIPVMTLTAFSLIAVFLLINSQNKNSEKTSV